MQCVLTQLCHPLRILKTTLRSGFFFNGLLWETTLVYDESIDHLLSNKEIKSRGYQSNVSCQAWLLSE
jgi:hypothetical protein